MEIAALVISAGFSRRMQSFKPLLTYEGVPFIISIILKLYSHLKKIFIVTGYRREDIEETLYQWFYRLPEPALLQAHHLLESEWNLLKDHVHCVYNADYDQGMFSSLQKGLSHCQDNHWVLYHFIDQPHIPRSFYGLFLQQISPDYNWIQPCYQHKKAHPLLLHHSLFPLILQERNTSSLQAISQHPLVKKKLWECQYPQVLQDFDSPVDYQSGE